MPFALLPSIECTTHIRGFPPQPHQVSVALSGLEFHSQENPGKKGVSLRTRGSLRSGQKFPSLTVCPPGTHRSIQRHGFETSADGRFCVDERDLQGPPLLLLKGHPSPHLHRQKGPHSNLEGASVPPTLACIVFLAPLGTMSAYTDVPGAASAAAGGGAIPSGIPMPSSSEPLQAPAAAAAAADSSSSSSSVGATYGDEGTHGQEKQQERFARQKLEQQQQQQARRLQGEADIAAADETPSSTHTAAATGAAVATPVSMNEKASTADVVVAKPALQQQEPRRSGWTAAFGGGSKKKTTNNRLEKKHHRSNSSSAADEASAASSTSSSSIVGADDEKRLAGAGATKKERRRGRGKAVIDAKHPVKEKDQHPPIGLLAMFRYATWFEAVLNIVGLVLAAGAGATQVSPPGWSCALVAPPLVLGAVRLAAEKEMEK